jgi:hypothetical protein
MKARFPVLALTIATLLSLSTLTHAPARAAAVDQCDRACLDSIVEKYVAALASHDPKKAPLAPGARYTENNVELPLPDGLWRTINAAGQISQVEAVLLSVPYGMRPGFSTGTHMPSPQALKDGFKEY